MCICTFYNSQLCITLRIPSACVNHAPPEPEHAVGKFWVLPELKDERTVPAANHGDARRGHVEEGEPEADANGGLKEEMQISLLIPKGSFAIYVQYIASITNY